MFRHDPQDTKPCPHMRLWVSAWADSALSGLARWYTQWHVAACPQCQKGLHSLSAVRDRLRVLEAERAAPPLTPDRRAAAEFAWEEADREKSGTAS